MTSVFPLERFKSIPTPFYYYDINLLQRTLAEVSRLIADKPWHMHYAVKANGDEPILSIIASAGFGADTVSLGEVKAALAAGFPAHGIVMAGVGKTDDEIRFGIRAGIACFNVESVEEMEIINGIALQMGAVARIALRINPDIDAHTHHYITTGLAENKFGIPHEALLAVAQHAESLPGIKLTGLHFHIGSQVTDFAPFAILCERINGMQQQLEDNGINIEHINVGGGLGIDYDNPDANPLPDFEAYFKAFEGLQLKPGQQLHFELGRALVAQCGSLISRVLYVKKGVSRNFAIIDAGMTDLIRPALYQAVHHIDNLTANASETALYDVVGPVCESSDVFATDVMLPVTRRGDLIAIRSAGAYGRAMASTYNCRPLPAVVVSQ